MMKTKFSHVNIISRDWRMLADFYIRVFDCKPMLPERDLSGRWVDQLTGLSDVTIRGIHLQLPGYEADGPTLEIFSYNEMKKTVGKEINRLGFGHIAFSVDDVQERLQRLMRNGGSVIGELIDAEIEGVGEITVVYAADPEGNIIEIQKWTDNNK